MVACGSGCGVWVPACGGCGVQPPRAPLLLQRPSLQAKLRLTVTLSLLRPRKPPPSPPSPHPFASPPPPASSFTLVIEGANSSRRVSVGLGQAASASASAAPKPLFTSMDSEAGPGDAPSGRVTPATLLEADHELSNATAGSGSAVAVRGGVVPPRSPGACAALCVGLVCAVQSPVSLHAQCACVCVVVCDCVR